jgi:hypothetical protein
MRWLESRVLWGGMLILGGVMFLLQNLGILPLGNLFWALLLALAGVFFLSIFFQQRANFWALIPGFTLFSITILIALEWLFPNMAGKLGGPIVLGGIGASFIVIYLIDRENWWALIPGGVMLTLTVITSLDSALPGFETGGIFFLGLGLTFALLGALSNPDSDLRWAWIPAGILVLAGVLFVAAAENLLVYIWPAGLILIGGYLIFRALQAR